MNFFGESDEKSEVGAKRTVYLSSWSSLILTLRMVLISLSSPSESESMEWATRPALTVVMNSWMGWCRSSGSRIPEVRMSCLSSP